MKELIRALKLSHLAANFRLCSDESDFHQLRYYLPNLGEHCGLMITVYKYDICSWCVRL